MIIRSSIFLSFGRPSRDGSLSSGLKNTKSLLICLQILGYGNIRVLFIQFDLLFINLEEYTYWWSLKTYGHFIKGKVI